MEFQVVDENETRDVPLWIMRAATAHNTKYTPPCRNIRSHAQWRSGKSCKKPTTIMATYVHAASIKEKRDIKIYVVGSRRRSNTKKPPHNPNIANVAPNAKEAKPS